MQTALDGALDSATLDLEPARRLAGGLCCGRASSLAGMGRGGAGSEPGRAFAVEISFFPAAANPGPDTQDSYRGKVCWWLTWRLSPQELRLPIWFKV